MKKRISLALRLLCLVALVVAEAVACYCILRTDLLPESYVAVLIGLLVAVAAGLGCLLFIHKRDGQVGIARAVISVLLCVLLIVGYVFVASLATEFYEAMLQITDTPAPNAERGVYVLTEDPANEIADAANYTFGMVSGYDESCSRQVLEALNTELGVQVKTQSFESVTDMLDALLEKQVDATILNGGFLSVLEEDSRYADLESKIRLLYTVAVLEETAVEAPEIEPLEPGVTNTPFILYLSGQDTRASKLSVSRSDVNILMAVNPNTKQILMINTPRDYYVAHPAGSEHSYREKLTHCGIYGVECPMQALENLYGIDVDYWAQINFTGFKKLIDEIGGVTVYSDRTFVAIDLYQIYAGENELNGEAALAFARDRYNQSGGDNGRGKNQMKVVKAVIEKITSGTTFIEKYPEIFGSLDGMFATNMPMEQVSQLAKMQLKDMSPWNMQTFAVTGTGDSCRTYTVPNLFMYVMHPNMETVEYAGTLIQRVFDGDILTEADMTMPES